MTFVSHAQNSEDVVLWRALKDVGRGFYIDVGAAWPDFHSVTKAFYERGWCGINIEPNPVFLKELNTARPRDINLGMAVGAEDRPVSLNIVSNPGLSTIDTAIAASHESIGFETEIHDVRMTTLTDICERNLPFGQEIHFLKIDVEGLEKDVLTGNDWSRYRPWIVVIEAMEPMSQIENHGEWEPVLLEAGYAYVYCDGLNRYYLANEHENLSGTFRYPLNLFDDYMSIEQQKAMIASASKDRLLEQAERQLSETETLLNETRTKAERLEAECRTLATEASQFREALHRLRCQVTGLFPQGEQGQGKATTIDEDLAAIGVQHSSLLNAVKRDHNRAFLRRLWFSRGGTPRTLLQRLILDRSSGRFRRLTKRLVFHKNGIPRRAFWLWALSGYPCDGGTVAVRNGIPRDG